MYGVSLLERVLCAVRLQRSLRPYLPCSDQEAGQLMMVRCLIHGAIARMKVPFQFLDGGHLTESWLVLIDQQLVRVRNG
jgi:hypothetical protein